MIAARRWPARLGYTAIAFGVWDVLYYVFLRMMSGWPTSVLDWDILFLLPLPWWGPVLAPVSIAFLMIVWGTFTTQFPDATVETSRSTLVWTLTFIGVALALYVFMADAVHVLPRGLDATRQVVPVDFNWPLFFVALALMSLPAVDTGRRVRRPSG